MLNIPHRLYNAFANPATSTVRGNTGLYPASASIEINGVQYGNCKRAEYYRWYRYEPTNENDPESFLILELGNSIHSMIAQLLRRCVQETDIVILSEEHAFFDTTEFISGRTDLFMKDLKTGLLHGCDVKSVGEYKASMVIDQPDISHILQCAVYLDQFNKSAKLNNSRPVSDWIILYVARNESWRLKKYPHGSNFKYMWQHAIDLDKGYVTVTSQNGSKKEYPDITMEKIYEGYRKLLKAIKEKKLPDRDFSLQYDEARLAGLHKAEELNKADTTTIEKWLKDGAKAGELDIDKGDFQCRFCSWQKLCYSANPEVGDKQKPVLYSVPKDVIVVKEVKECLDTDMI